MKLDEFVYKLCTEGKNFAAVSTLMPDGSPQVSIVWVDADEEYIYINTAEGRLKPRNMRRDKRVAIAIFDAGNPYRQAHGERDSRRRQEEGRRRARGQDGYEVPGPRQISIPRSRGKEGHIQDKAREDTQAHVRE